MFLALKELRYGKLRFAMIGFIIVLVAWLVFILSGLGNGLSTLSAATIKNMDADYVVFEEGSSSSFSKSMLSESISSDLKDQANVEEIAPFGSAMGAILKEGSDEGQDKTDVAILGISPGSFLEPKLIEGKPLDEKNQLGVIAAGLEPNLSTIALKRCGIKAPESLIALSTCLAFVIGIMPGNTGTVIPASLIL